MVKSNIEFSYKKLGKRVPYSIKNLSEHKLRVEYNANNDVVTARGRNYPEVRWYTVITVSRINPNEELEIKLMRFTKKFQQLLSDKAKPSPGKRFMNFQLNSGNDAILKGCMKYMGDDHTAIEDTVNTELIELGRQPHKYHYGETLDKMLPDYYIKKLLEDSISTQLPGIQSTTMSRKLATRDSPRVSCPTGTIFVFECTKQVEGRHLLLHFCWG